MAKLRVLYRIDQGAWYTLQEPIGTGVLTLSAIWNAWLWPSPALTWLYAYRGEAR